MICRLPPRRALWHDSPRYRVYVHRSGALEIERLRDHVSALLSTELAYTLACRIAVIQRGGNGVMNEAALDRLCSDFDHVIDRAAERARPPHGVVLTALHARAS
jgi:hypothetical protein